MHSTLARSSKRRNDFSYGATPAAELGPRVAATMGFVAMPFVKPSPGIRFRFLTPLADSLPLGISFRFFGQGRERLSDFALGGRNGFCAKTLDFRSMVAKPKSATMLRVIWALGSADLLQADCIVTDTTLPRSVRYLGFTLAPPSSKPGEGFHVVRKLCALGLGKRVRMPTYGFPMTSAQHSAIINRTHDILVGNSIHENTRTTALQRLFFVLLGGFDKPLLWKGNDS